jgi:hypothetical protein
MKRTPRILAAAGVAALSAAVAGPLSAHADADGDNDVVVFTGHVLTQAPVPLVGSVPGGIGYNLVVNLCVHTSSDGEFGACAMNQVGTANYVSTACGTGVAVGAVNVTEPQDGTVYTINYAIELAGGVGIIAGDATGVVHLNPNPFQGNPPLGTCGSDFNITGTATVTN